MSVNPLAKIDPYYFFLTALLLALFLLAFFTIKGVVSTISIAGRLDKGTAVKYGSSFNKEKFEKAYRLVFEKEKVLLDLNN